MAKGAIAKEQITQKILETFPGSFLIDKVIRIPMSEDGTPIQIKVSLTAAKDIVDLEGEASAAAAQREMINFEDEINPPVEKEVNYTQEEKDNIATLLKALNLA